MDCVVFDIHDAEDYANLLKSIIIIILKYMSGRNQRHRASCKSRIS